MRRIRRKKIVRAIVLCLALDILFTAVYPTVSYALTSGSTQPEIFGNQPADATDNVNLLTGAFNYTIPITSLPEYPMAIGYSSGIGMDQEASCFGLGFNGFSGAVGRNLVGIPDDMNGSQKRQYRFDNLTNWDASVEGTFGASTQGPVGVGASVGLKVGYDNYKGVYGALSLGIGITAKLGKSTKGLMKGAGIGAGLGITSDSRYGASESVGIGISTGYTGKTFGNAVGLGVGKSLNSRATYAGLTAFQNPVMAYTNVGLYSGTGGMGETFVPPLANVAATTSGFGISLTVPLGSFSVTGAYSQFKSGKGDLTKSLFGYSNLSGYNREQRDHLADFSTEGEDSFNDNYRNNPSYLQKDFFSVNCQGLSGSMQFVSDEYGVFSRNYSRYQYRDIFLYVKTDRKEVFPWDKTRKSVYNRQVDLLKLLKKPSQEGDADFDNNIFIEEDRTDSYSKFKGKPQLRFRGDMAGEMNMSSNSWNDYEPNAYEISQVPGAGDGKRLFFFGYEDAMPMYNMKVSGQDAYKKGTIDKSSKIDYLQNGDGTISQISIKKQDGMVYVFGAPVLVKSAKTIQLGSKGTDASIGDKVGAPKVSGDESDYNSYDGKNYNKVTIEDPFSYPYAWLLTEIRGYDYIDFDNNGTVNDKDLGYWVKFNYTTVQNYNFREPYAGLEHTPMMLHDRKSDVYSASFGTKDIKYINTIESRDFICIYNYENRTDGLSAKQFAIGNGTNTLSSADYVPQSGDRGTVHLKKCTSIDLYKKQPYTDKSFRMATQAALADDGTPIWGLKVRSTNFDYYSTGTLCPGTPNAESGKLTLQKVYHTTYQYDANGNMTSFKTPSHRFEYAHTTYDDSDYNPNYDRKALDMWGNYHSRAKYTPVTGEANFVPSGAKYYKQYHELSKTVADKNAKVYALTKIYLPAGGSMQVGYEAGGYGKVQNASPYCMRQIRTTANSNELYVDVSDIAELPTSAQTSVLGELFKVGTTYWSEIGYTQGNHEGNNNVKFDDLFLAKGNITITSNNSLTLYTDLEPGRTYIKLTTNDDGNLPLKDLKDYLYGESSKMKAVKDQMGSTCPGGFDERKYDGLEQAGILDAAKSIVTSMGKYFVSPDAYKGKFHSCYGYPGTHNLPAYSYMRTSIVKEKYTGCRVKSITFRDNFQYSSDGGSASAPTTRENAYTTNYYYDSKGDGTGYSTGVATTEPGGGRFLCDRCHEHPGSWFFTFPYHHVFEGHRGKCLREAIAGPNKRAGQSGSFQRKGKDCI